MSTSSTDPNEWRPAQRMDPDSTYRFRVPIHELAAEITPNEMLFVLAHFGVPRIQITDWRLQVAGKVGRPGTLDLSALKRFPKHDVESFLKCAGFPDDPSINTHNVSNAVWSGAELGQVLDYFDVDTDASYVWFYGSDHGMYARWSANEYVKDLPMVQVRKDQVLLAYEVNGQPLSAEHGFPVRVFIPGFYGTNSVKWLSRIEVADRRAPGIFSTRLYNDQEIRPDGSKSIVPVWEALPDSIVVHPRDKERLAPGEVSVIGWAWGHDEIALVEVSLNDGEDWYPARVSPRRQHSWQRFEWKVNCRRDGETTTITVRASDRKGRSQPLRAARNCSHSITVYFEGH